MHDLDKVPPEPDLRVALEEPSAGLHAVLGADLVPHVPADDGGPVPGLPVPHVDRGGPAEVAVKGDGEDLALVAGDIIGVKVDVTESVNPVLNVKGEEDGGSSLLAVTAADRDGLEAEERNFALEKSVTPTLEHEVASIA